MAAGAHPTLVGARVLLLDADGVFLRLPEARRLESIELFEAFLREPEVEDLLVVACGEWKRHLGLAGVRKLFAPDLRERFAGVTPDIVGTDGFRSHVEINAWLAEHPQIADYVVLEGGHCWTRLPALESAVFVDWHRGVLGTEDLALLARHLGSGTNRLGEARPCRR